MSTRIYNTNIELERNKVKDFYNNRASNVNDYSAVLLSAHLKDGGQNRDEMEKNALLPILKNKKYTILDIGCGMGRWAEALQDNIKIYNGIDFAENFINKANDKFKNNSNISFFAMDICEPNYEKLLKKYDLIIMTGVLMYINDNEIGKILSLISNLLDDNGIFFSIESVSTIKQRLTLKNHYSNELNTTYNAIYRTVEEYNDLYIRQNMLIASSKLILNENSGARKETNACYWEINKN